MMITSVVGARPNFMKIAPVVLELKRRGIPQRLVHTGQHYDAAMSKVFFEELGMPEPDLYLGVGSGSHAQQTARVMVAMEEDCLQFRPDVLVVGGDVNSTVAAAMAAAKLGIPVAHVEAGLRSFDREMPEELNRIVTDHLSELLLTSEESGNANLLREGVDPERIHLVGNCMVDSLRKHHRRALAARPWEAYGLRPAGYALLTLHRPSNVDCGARLAELLEMAGGIAHRVPMVFPVHPRTRQRLRESGQALPESVFLTDPQPYVTFLGLMAGAAVVMTDSGGIQEETTALEIPCLTLRRNTERPSTVEIGSNAIVGDDLAMTAGMVDRILRGEWKKGSVPPLWDGRAAERVVDALTGERALARAAGSRRVAAA